MKTSLFSKSLIALIFFLVTSACNKYPVDAPPSITGNVVAKESCTGVDAEEYWVIETLPVAGMPDYGDSITIGGTTYTRAIKVKGLDDRARKLGVKVKITFDIITPNKIGSTGCTIANPTTFELKVITIKTQALST